MRATFRTVEGLTTKQVVNQALKAMSEITGCDNGTLRNPLELASSRLPDGRTLIESIYEDDSVRYNDGWFIVEVDDYKMYVDLTASAIREEFGVQDGEQVPYEYIGNLASNY